MVCVVDLFGRDIDIKEMWYLEDVIWGFRCVLGVEVIFNIFNMLKIIERRWCMWYIGLERVWC